MSVLPLLDTVRPGPQLRPYQVRDANKILKSIAAGASGTLYVLPPGGGKTVTTARVVGEAESNHWSTWFFVHRRELLRQASAKLDAVGVPHGIVAPGSEPSSHRVQVCSIDTVDVRLGSLADRMAKVRIGVFDEGHHIVSSRWSRVAKAMPASQRLLLTATPYRLDGRGLGEHCNAVVEGPSIAELVRLGFLLQPAVFAPPSKLDLSSVAIRGGDWATSGLAAVVDNPELTWAAVRNYARLAPGVPVIAYCVDVAHAEHVAEAFTMAGWNAASVDGTMSHGDRDRRLAALASGELQVLTSCDLIGEGLDVPAVGGCILLRPTKSTGLYVQQTGRPLRLHPDQTMAFIIDQVGNAAIHGMPDERRRWSLDQGIKGIERAVAPTRRCRACYYVTQQGPASCPYCGKPYGNAPTSLIKVTDLELATMPGFAGLTAEELAGLTYKALTELARTEADFKTIARLRGYSPGWTRKQLELRGKAKVPFWALKGRR